MDNLYGGVDISIDEYWSRLGQDLKFYFNELPNTYVVLDLETTDVRPSDGKIIQIGYLVCQNDIVVANHDFYLKTDEEELNTYAQSSYVKTKQAEGNDGYIKPDDVRKFGCDRSLALKAIAELLYYIDKKPGSALIGHNACGFDIPFLEYESACAGIQIPNMRNKVIDTGQIVKASKLKMLPDRYLPFWEFLCFIREFRAQKLSWSLSNCIREFNLQLPTNQTHNAKFDALCTHELWRCIKQKM